MRKVFLYKFFMFAFAVASLCDAHAVTIRGRTQDSWRQAIPNVAIYEEYGPDTPVTYSDAKGNFTYTTADDTPVHLIARKKGWVEAEGKPESPTDPDSDTIFEMFKFFKPRAVTIYAILGDDKDCLLNTEISWSGHCVDEINNYIFDSFNGTKCTEGFVQQDKDGGFTVPNLRAGETFFYGQYSGGGTILNSPDSDKLYYNILEEDVTFEKLISKYEQSYEFGRAVDMYENISKEDYISAHIHDFFKFCPRKLNEWAGFSDTTKNKLLSGLSMAAAGIGGMELAQGLAEKSVDAKYERDMQDYTDKFECRVGNNVYDFGDKNLESPGANLLTTQKQNYAAAAYSLKTRKNALGLKPGIESEVEITLNEGGLPVIQTPDDLYDNVGATRNKHYDDDAVATEKETTVTRVKGGAIVATAGIVGGMIGNKLMNQSDRKTEKLLEQEFEPRYCGLQACLDKLTITARTKKTPLYQKASDFCTSQFPDEPDCIKIMLIYGSGWGGGGITDIAVLKANNYDINYYKETVGDYCDTVCGPNAYHDSQLFSDYWYNSKENSKKTEEFINWLKKCFKTAGALDYFDFNTYVGIADNLTIEYNKIDCTKLDNGKTDESTIVRGNHIKPSVAADVDYIKKLLGNQAIYIKSNK